MEHFFLFVCEIFELRILRNRGRISAKRLRLDRKWHFVHDFNWFSVVRAALGLGELHSKNFKFFITPTMLDHERLYQNRSGDANLKFAFACWTKFENPLKFFLFCNFFICSAYIT